MTVSIGSAGLLVACTCLQVIDVGRNDTILLFQSKRAGSSSCGVVVDGRHRGVKWTLGFVVVSCGLQHVQGLHAANDAEITARA